MEGIPEQIEGGNLVGEELDCEQSDSGPNHPPATQQMQSARQLEQFGVSQQSQGGHGGIDIQPGGEAYCHDQAYEFSANEYGSTNHHA
jgi:hypothetical protein